MTKLPLGRKQAEQAVRWIGTLSTFGAAGGLTVLYMTDWKAVLKFVPFYGSKFPKDEEK